MTRVVYSTTCPETKIAPMMNVMMNQRRSLATSPRSAAKTPIWQVTELSTRIRVLVSANGMLRNCVSSAQTSGFTARRVRYIANRPAKNINSLDSQTMVPTATRFGRLAGA